MINSLLFLGKSMKNIYKYRAFISYSHKDKAFASWLHKRIENYKIPKSLRKKYPNLPKDLKRSIFRDEEELPIAVDLPENLSYALKHSELLIVICSPNAVNSYWVDKEIKDFKLYHGERKVFAIIKEGKANANDPIQEAFPKSLIYKIDTTGSLTNEKIELIAGNAQKRGDREKELIRLIAGMLKIDFADLWQREKKDARKRKVFKLSLLALFVALVLYTSTQFVGENTNQKLERIENRIITIEYIIRNEESSTSKLIELNNELKKLKQDRMNVEDTNKWLGKYKTPLLKQVKKVANEERVGTKKAIKILTSTEAKANREKRKKESSKELVALAKLYVQEYQFKEANQSYAEAIDEFFDYENVLEYANFLDKQNRYQRAIELYEQLQKKRLKEEEKSDIFNNLAILYYKVNQLNEAEEAYLEALTIDRALAKTNPSEYNSDLSDILNNLAILYDKVNQVKEAEEAYLEALKIYRTLAKTNPSTYNFYVSNTLNNLASLYNKVNRIKEAEEAFLEALAVRRALAKTNPSLYNFYVSNTLNNLANLYYKNNRLKEAEGAYLEALKIYRALAKTNPSAYNSNVAMSLNNLANLYNKVNRVKEAEEAYLEALKIRKSLAKTNPSAYNSDVAMSLNNLASLYNKVNRIKASEGAYLEALKIYRVLAKSNTSAYNFNVSMSLNNLANLYYKNDQIKEAKEAYLEALKIRRTLAKNTLSTYSFYLSNTLNNLASLYNKVNQPKEAEEAYLEALAIRRALAKTNPSAYNADVAKSLNSLANLYNKLNRVEEAQEAYLEALSIRRTLAKTNPSVYGIDFANSLVMGVYLLHQPIKNLDEAENILESFKKVSKSKQLLTIIKKLKSKPNPEH